MNSKQLLEEFDLELDDVRWYLSIQQAEDILSHYQQPLSLIRKIWDKQLEADLYDMEERFLADIDRALTQGTVDEIKIRQRFKEIRAAKRRRKT